MAEAIAEGWRGADTEVDVRRAREVRDLGPFQAVVVGTSVHMGRLPGEIRGFASRHSQAFSRMPVAYFVVFLTMAEDTPENRQATLAYLAPLRRAAPEGKPMDIGLFAGAVLDDTKEFKSLFPLLKFPARAMARSTPDRRDWAAIRAWAEGVRPALLTE